MIWSYLSSVRINKPMKRNLIQCLVSGIVVSTMPSFLNTADLTAPYEQKDRVFPVAGDAVMESVRMDTISIYNERGVLKSRLPYRKDVDDTLPVPKYLNVIKGYPQSDTIYGDFDGNGVQDTAWFKSETEAYCAKIVKNKLTVRVLYSFLILLFLNW
jgi:hypothetical protein